MDVSICLCMDNIAISSLQCDIMAQWTVSGEASAAAEGASETASHSSRSTQKPALSNKQRQRQKQLRKRMGMPADADDRTTCMMCKQNFDSRNALFTHLQKCTAVPATSKAGRKRK